MITNQRQYLNTQAQAERFRQALAAPEPAGMHPRALKAMRDGLRSQLGDLETELAEYDALRNGRISTLEARSIVGIGEALTGTAAEDAERSSWSSRTTCGTTRESLARAGEAGIRPSRSAASAGSSPTFRARNGRQERMP
jgi:hypothetical protein